MIRNDLPRGLVDNPNLDQWVGFEREGMVRLGTGKVELGQGVLTALRQIAAEELDVEPGRITVVSGETGRSPEEGFTAGSQSIEASGGAIRLACAEVRQIAVALAAEQIGCGAEQVWVEDGQFLREGTPTALSYWSLADALDLHRAATGSAPVRPSAQLRVVGQSLQRTDLPEKLCGAGFIHDLRPEGMLHARVLRQPHRGARLLSLDEARVQRGGGAQVTIVRIGDFLAVAADDEAVADRALEAAGHAATWEGASDARPEHADPRYLQTLPAIDRVVTAAGRTEYTPTGRVAEASYTRPYMAHGSIGPSCALAVWHGAALTVWSHSQGVGPLRRSIARALKLDPAAVTVLHRPGAGCYGHNGADDAALDAALVAFYTPGRPVRVRWTREDEMSAAPVGAASVVTLRAGLGADGRAASWDVEIWSPPHGKRPGAHGGINLLAERALPGGGQSGGLGRRA